jgi:hypothetical protein
VEMNREGSSNSRISDSRRSVVGTQIERVRRLNVGRCRCSPRARWPGRSRGRTWRPSASPRRSTALTFARPSASPRCLRLHCGADVGACVCTLGMQCRHCCRCLHFGAETDVCVCISRRALCADSHQENCKITDKPTVPGLLQLLYSLCFIPLALTLNPKTPESVHAPAQLHPRPATAQRLRRCSRLRLLGWSALRRTPLPPPVLTGHVSSLLPY